MSIDIRLPNLSGSDHEMLLGIRNYLYQLREQLQYELDNINSGGSGGGVTIIDQGGSSTPRSAQSAEETFNSIKALIIKSADIVDAYYEEIDKKLVSSYEALSEFGSFRETAESRINANAEGITQSNERVQAIEAVYRDGGKYAAIIKNSGYVKAGFLDEDAYGLEVGQVVEENGVEVFRGFGRFTPDKISFFDRNGNETAWLSNRRLRAYEVEALEKQQIGGFVDIVDEATGDVKTKWVGMEEVTFIRRFFR